MLSGAGRVSEIAHRLSELEHRMADASGRGVSDAEMNRYGELQIEFQHLNGYELENTAQAILGGLGIGKERRTVVPRDLPDKRRVSTTDETRNKQAAEKKQLADYYERRRRELQEPVAATRPKTEPCMIDARKRNNQEELKRLAELERKDKRVLKNRQKRELEKLKKRPRK